MAKMFEQSVERHPAGIGSQATCLRDVCNVDVDIRRPSGAERRHAELRLSLSEYLDGHIGGSHHPFGSLGRWDNALGYGELLPIVLVQL